MVQIHITFSSAAAIFLHLFASGAAATGGATGSPIGFAGAAGTTGGGSATAATPSSIDELVSWLGDDVARVITISSEYNFVGSEGTCTDCAGCIPTSYTCSTGGQLAIDNGQGWCDDLPSTTVTYDKAGLLGITVNSNKSLIGVGSNAIIAGKGLRIVSGAENVIIQNIHFTNVNPQYIWGGDLITLDGTDKVWIDHCKFSLVGRQMFVTGYDASNRVTLSNNEFDGETSWSATCDGRHYWTLLGYGDQDLITLYGNYIHHTSGRSPQLEYNSVWHAVNNYWLSNSGFAFAVYTGANALIEGNVFDDVVTSISTVSTAGQIFVPTSSTASDCETYLGRACQVNSVISSGSLSGTASAFLVDFNGYSSYVPAAMSASAVAAYVVANAGVGKI